MTTLRDLDPFTRERAINYFLADYIPVVAHAVRDDHCEYHLPTPVREALEDSIVDARVLDLDVLRNVVGNVCYTLKEERHTLTPDEIAIRESAWRLSDALNNGTRVTYRPRPVRGDGTSD